KPELLLQIGVASQRPLAALALEKSDRAFEVLHAERDVVQPLTKLLEMILMGTGPAKRLEQLDAEISELKLDHLHPRLFAARHVGGKTQRSELGWRRHVDAKDLLEVLNRFIHVPHDDADMRDGEAPQRRRALAAELLDRGDETNHRKYHDDTFSKGPSKSRHVSSCLTPIDG